MPLSESLMYAVLAALAGAYYLYQNAGWLQQSQSPDKPTTIPASSTAQEWEEQWVTTLMRLQNELAEEGRECCIPLVRELIWRFMGGEPNDVPARPSAKK